MIKFIGGKRALILNCVGCPSNASMKNPDCLDHISKFKNFDVIIFDKGLFIKLVEDPFGKQKERVFPGFSGFVLFDCKNCYKIKPEESKLSKDEIDEILYAFEEIKKNEEPKLNKKIERIVKRHVKGFGVLEYLMNDRDISDIYINPGDLLVYVNHRKYGNIKTNLAILPRELERIASKLRIYSGRPFDESIPEIHVNINEFNVRVTGIREPITFEGIGFAIRKHLDNPYTIEDLIKEKLFSKRIGALLWFLIDSGASILISGNRGAGKTTLLGAMLLKIPKNERIIVIEDIDELPVNKLMELGYNVAHLRIKSTTSNYEKTAEEVLRTSLRLGESTLVIGEVRGKEAKHLFEAMRVGAVGNTVLGTIHGSRVNDVFDRVVNDLGVPKTSFKATDFIIMLNLIKDEKSGKRTRRLEGIYYVDKKWKDTPKFIKIADSKRIINTKPLEDFAKRINTTPTKAINSRLRKI